MRRWLDPRDGWRVATSGRSMHYLSFAAALWRRLHRVRPRTAREALNGFLFPAERATKQRTNIRQLVERSHVAGRLSPAAPELIAAMGRAASKTASSNRSS